MATLQYTVYNTAGATANGPVLNEGVITIGGTSAAGAIMDADAGNKARRVRIAVDTDCWVTWDADPTAVNDGSEGRMMFAGSWEYVEVLANHKIAVIERA
jgi:hypothetical protein